MADRPLQIVTACRARDLAVLEITARKLRETVPFWKLHVVAPDKDCRRIRSRLVGDVQVIAENEFIPGMTIEALRELKVPYFPKAAGWYFQQLLKLQFAFVEPEEDYYLIWDADTVPLRPMRFFDLEGRMLLTKATEHHAPYFETYRRLFASEPDREFSFIAQHMLVQKSIAREMLGRIEQRIGGSGNWAWKIMRSLPETGDNLFSEYETYGHYVKNHCPERVVFVERPWQRRFQPGFGRRIPSEREMQVLARDFDYVAFELATQGWRRLVKPLLARLRAVHR
ncbi:MAG: hypothetical protein HY298_07325 [Verrucomicrobia bacterium]|nr:hypothetical protein [Verrucomicrobiota bacterium]